MADASTIGILRVLLQADKGEFSPVMKAAVTELVKFGDESTKAGTKAKTAAGGLKGFSDGLAPITRGLQDIGGAANPLTGSLSKLQGVASSLASGVGALGPAGAAAAIGLGAITAGAVAAVAAIGAVASELIDLTKHAADAGDELFTLSNKSGLSVEALSTFQFVAQQTDTSVDAIVGSIGKLGENLSKGSKETTKAIEAIGLSVADLRKMSPDDAFKTIITTLGQIPDAGQRSAAGVAIFGKKFREIAQLTQEDFDGLNAKAKEWGLVFGSEFAAAGDRFNDAMGLIGLAVQAVQNRIGAEFLPVATAFVETFGDHFIAALAVASEGTAGFGNAVASMTVAVGQAIADMVAAVTPLVAKLAKFFVDTFSGLLSWIAKTQSALGTVASHIPVLHDVGEAMLQSSKALTEAGVTGADAADKLKTKIDVYAEAITEAAKRTSTGLPQAVKTVQRELAEQARKMDAARKAAGSFGGALGDLTGDQKDAAKAADEHRQALADVNAELGGVEARVTQADFIRQAVDGMEDWEAANIGTTGSLGDLLEKLPQVSAETEDAALKADMLTDAYHELGLKTPAELQKVADKATWAYQQIVASVGQSAPQAIEAHKKMVEAINAATGKVPSFWETNIFPRVKNVVETMQTAVQGSFSQMLLGAKGFKDGFIDIWQSIKAGILNILASIADAFINSFLKGLLGAITGQQGAFSKAFAGLFGGGSGGGIPGTGGLLSKLLGKIPGVGGLLGGGTALAGAPGTVTAGIPSVAGVGTTVPIGGVPGATAGGAGIGAAGAGLLSGGAGFGLGMLGQHFFGRGAGSAAFGAGTGAAAGAAIAAALAPATLGLSLAIGGVAGLLGGLLKFGPSKEERAARQITGGFKEQTFAGLSQTQRTEAMNAGWTDPKAAGTLIAVRDAYLAVGKSAADAEKDVAAMWAAEVKGPEATQDAMVPILAALDEYKKKTGDASAADAAHQQVIAAKTAEYQKQADTIREQMKGLDDELAKINASERPEAHMGSREKQARERIATQKAELDKQLNDLQAKIDTVTTAKPQEQFKALATVGQQALMDLATGLQTEIPAGATAGVEAAKAAFDQLPAAVQPAVASWATMLRDALATGSSEGVDAVLAKIGELPAGVQPAIDALLTQFGLIKPAADTAAGQTVDAFTSKFGLIPGIADAAVGGVFEKFGRLPNEVGGAVDQTVTDIGIKFGRLPEIAGGPASEMVEEMRRRGFHIMTLDAGSAVDDIASELAKLPGAAGTAADGINRQLDDIGEGLDPIIVKYRFKREGDGLPEGGDIPGHAAGGVFSQPHLAQIAEGGQAEIVGSVDFMTRALEGALGRVGGTLRDALPAAVSPAVSGVLGEVNQIGPAIAEQAKAWSVFSRQVPAVVTPAIDSLIGQTSRIGPAFSDQFVAAGTVGGMTADDLLTAWHRFTVETNAGIGTIAGPFGSITSAGLASAEQIGYGFTAIGGQAEDAATRATAALGSIGKDVEPVTIKYRFSQEGPGLPDGGEIPGHALGGVFTRPHVAAIAEGGQAEIVGSVGFMTKALEGAIGRVSQAAAGGAKIFIMPIVGTPSDDDISRWIDTAKRAEPRIAGNDSGVRTSIRSAVGIR